MKTWEELIKKMDVYRIWEDEATNYTKQILDDINEWLEESTEKENTLEEKRNKKFKRNKERERS